jgi:hypothetical protein
MCSEVVSDKVCHQGRIEDMSADMTRRTIRNPRQWVLLGPAMSQARASRRTAVRDANYNNSASVFFNPDVLFLSLPVT